jgi:hypothetical protein
MEFKEQNYFVNKVETQLIQKTTQGQPNPGNLLSEDKGST